MKKLFIKIKYLFIPYILLGVGTILFLAGFRWIFNFHWNLLNLKIEIWELWIPICLPFFSVLFILRNRIKIIKQSKDERRHFFYQMIMVIAITVPNFLFQAYWSKALFDLQTVNSITEIENFPKEKYFKINNFNVDREKFAIHTVMETSGRYNRQLNLEFYASAPFGELKSNYWYGKKYSELSENEGEEQN
ncbi:MAG: rhomboid protease GluP [Paraglaciecola sp.]|jgi:rhomboid protease GluP